MRGFRVLVAKELSEQWRTMRLPSGLAVFAFIGIASPLLARYMPEILAAVGGSQLGGLVPQPTIHDSFAQLVKNVGQLGAAFAIIVAMSSVSAERDRGTLAFVLSKPVSRTTYLAAKLTALCACLVVEVAFAGALAYVYTAILFSSPGASFLLMMLLAAVTLVVVAAVTFAASTVTRSTIAAGGIGFGLLVITGAISLFPGASPYTPSGLLARGLAVMGSSDYGSLAGPLALQVGVVVAAFGAAVAALRRQEI